MQQGGVGVARELPGQAVNAIEKGHEIRLRIRRGHCLDRVFQFDDRAQQIAFQRIFHKQILSFVCVVTMRFSSYLIRFPAGAGRWKEFSK
jgi:hypothetical protein